MTQAAIILTPLHSDNRFVTFSTTESRLQLKQSTNRTKSTPQNQNVAENNTEECLFTTLLCSDILIELLLNCTPQISAYLLNKEITATLTRTGDQFAEKACKRKWSDATLEKYAAKSWQECFWLVDKVKNPETYVHRPMPYATKNTKSGYLIHKVTPIKAKRVSQKQWLVLKGSLLLSCRNAMELRPHSIKILTHECHAYLATLAENRAQGQFHLHFPDDKTLTFVAGTLKDAEDWVSALKKTIQRLIDTQQQLNKSSNSLNSSTNSLSLNGSSSSALSLSLSDILQYLQ
jgi:hypothetical protein